MPSEILDAPALSRRLVAGDEAAYREFYAAYFPRLYRYLFVLTGGNDAAIRDALQTTFLRVAKHVKIFPDEPTLWSWLTVLARNAAYDDSRKRHRYFAFLDRFQKHAEVDGLAADEQQSGDRLELLLEKSLARLRSEERELLELKYFSHHSVRKIADRFQFSEKAIESRLTRARENLREIIKKEAKNVI